MMQGQGPMPPMNAPPPGLSCGLFTKEGPIPMVDLNVKIHILNGISKVVMVQTFKNLTKKPQDVSYDVPEFQFGLFDNFKCELVGGN